MVCFHVPVAPAARLVAPRGVVKSLLPDAESLKNDCNASLTCPVPSASKSLTSQIGTLDHVPAVIKCVPAINVNRTNTDCLTDCRYANFASTTSRTT